MPSRTQTDGQTRQTENNIKLIYTPLSLLQNSSIEGGGGQKKNSVRHKLVSLTLKRKSKITEEVCVSL